MKPIFRFERFSDSFLPQDMPHDPVQFAVLVYGTCQSGHNTLPQAIQRAGLHLALGCTDVVVSCRNITTFGELEGVN